MSEDLVKRSDVINLLWYFQDECCSAVVGDFEKIPSADRLQDDEYKNFDRGDLIALIEAQEERIDELLADRPQGEWIHEIDDMGIYRQHTVRCSNCKCGFTNAYVVLLCGDTGDLFRYCPHCGARMKGADDEV